MMNNGINDEQENILKEDQADSVIPSLVDLSGDSELPLWTLRTLNDSDFPMIFNFWAKKIYESYPMHFVPQEIFFPAQEKVIKNCLHKYQTLVLSFLDDPSQIIGFINYFFFSGILIINWAQIRGPFRQQGIMGGIINNLYPDSKKKIIILTQFSKYFQKLNHKYNLIYDPFFLIDH